MFVSLGCYRLHFSCENNMVFLFGVHLAKISIINLPLVPVKWNCSVQESVKKATVLTLLWLNHLHRWSRFSRWHTFFIGLFLLLLYFLPSLGLLFSQTSCWWKPQAQSLGLFLFCLSFDDFMALNIPVSHQFILQIRPLSWISPSKIQMPTWYFHLGI